MTKILHTADWQYGYRQYGFRERESDFYRVGNAIAKQAIDLKVDGVILAGDNFDMVKPPANAVLMLRDQIAAMKAKGIEVVGIEGNHDATDGDWLRICGGYELVPNRPYEIGGVKLVGINYCRPAVFWATINEMVDRNVKADVLVMHQDLAEMAGFGDQEITALELAPKLRDMGIRHVAMGHIHQYKEMELGGVRFVYAGAPEMNALDEREEKSFSLLNIDGDDITTAVYPVPAREFYQLEVKVQEDVDNLLTRVEEHPDAFTVLWYDPANRTLAKHAEEILRSAGRMYRSVAMTAEAGSLADQVARNVFERKGALGNLKDAVEAFFEEGSDSYQLVLQCLDNPDNVEAIVQNYLKSKGLR